MALIRVCRDGNVIKSVFFAGEAISHLASLEIASGGARYVRPGSDTYECRAAGVAIGGVSSGEIVRAVTHGIVSGVICIDNVNPGDRVTLASGGRITPLNTITPAGAVSGYITGEISGYIPAGATGIFSGAIASGSHSGYLVSGVGFGIDVLASGALTINTPSVFSSGLLAGHFNSGLFAGTAFDTARVLGKAIASGLSGYGVQLLVTLGG